MFKNPKLVTNDSWMCAYCGEGFKRIPDLSDYELWLRSIEKVVKER